MFDPLAHLNRPIPDYLRQLLGISNKSELEKFAKRIMITMEDFSTPDAQARSQPKSRSL
jgi:hypothetical protein